MDLFANQYLKKGSGLLVEGRLQIRTYDKDGQKRSAFEVLVNELQLLDPKNGAPPATDAEDEGRTSTMRSTSRRTRCRKGRRAPSGSGA